MKKMLFGMALLNCWGLFPLPRKLYFSGVLLMTTSLNACHIEIIPTGWLLSAAFHLDLLLILHMIVRRDAAVAIAWISHQGWVSFVHRFHDCSWARGADCQFQGSAFTTGTKQTICLAQSQLRRRRWCLALYCVRAQAHKYTSAV